MNSKKENKQKEKNNTGSVSWNVSTMAVAVVPVIRACAFSEQQLKKQTRAREC